MLTWTDKEVMEIYAVIMNKYRLIDLPRFKTSMVSRIESPLHDQTLSTIMLILNLAF